MISVLLEGTLIAAPVSQTASTGKPFTLSFGLSRSLSWLELATSDAPPALKK